MAEAHIYTDAFVADNSWNGREHNHCLLNDGAGGFLEAGYAIGLDDLRDGRGLAASDFDRDGDIDFIIGNYKAQAGYFENLAGQTRNWLAVRLQGTRSNRDAVGAEIEIRTARGVQSRLVGAGHGYAGQNSYEQLFGLGGETEIEDVLVRWPSGLWESFGSASARQRMRLVEGQGREQARPEAEVVAGPPASRVSWYWWLGSLCGILLALRAHKLGRKA